MIAKPYDFCLFNIPKKGSRVIREITNRCNYHCKYCIANSDFSEKEKELSLPEIKVLMDTLKKHRTLHIKFTGGEPFLRQDILAILQYADHLDFSFDLSTNASLLTESLVQELAKLKHLLYIHVSLDGDSKISQENIRGKGSFTPTIQGIQLLKKHGIYVRIGTVIYKHNENILENILNFVITLGGNEIIFSLMESAGRLEGDDTLLTTKSTAQLTQELTLLQQKYTGKIRVSYAFSKQVASTKQGTCPGCKKFFYLNAVGQIAPCTRIAKHFPTFLVEKKDDRETTSTFKAFVRKMAQLGWRGCPKTFLNETKEILHIDAYLTKIKQQIFAKGRRFGEDGALYSFTTENITGYYQHFNFQEKNCLTIGGSGDHMINAFLLGAKKVDIFDTNPLAKYYIELKRLCLQKLSYQQFLTFLMINKKTFSYEVYQTLREELSICCRYFFDELYQIFSYNGEKLRTSEVFNTTYDEKEKKIRYNIYLKSEEFYNTCAKLLKNKSYQFFLTDFRNLHSLPSITTYDYILFSNISDYLSEWYPGAKPIERFAQDLANLSTKSDATLLMFAYIYDISSKKTRSPIDTLDGQNYLLSILSATSYDFPSALAPTTKDRILYQEKKKSLMEDSECYTSKSNVYEIFSQAEDYPKKILQEVVPLITGKIVLDIGCGTGKFLPDIANDAFQTYGLDKSASQLALAAEKCKEKKVQFFCQDATNLPLATESVEVIIGSRFFSTLTSPERQNQVFREMMRVLKKGGSIYLIENSHLGGFEIIRKKPFLPENPTLIYNERLEQVYGFFLFKEISTYFRFNSLKQAKEVFTTIYGKPIIQNINSKTIEHKVLIFKTTKP